MCSPSCSFALARVTDRSASQPPNAIELLKRLGRSLLGRKKKSKKTTEEPVAATEPAAEAAPPVAAAPVVTEESTQSSSPSARVIGQNRVEVGDADNLVTQQLQPQSPSKLRRRKPPLLPVPLLLRL